MESSLNFYQSDHQQSQQQQRRQESIDKNSANLNHNNHLKNLSKFNYDVGSNNNKQFRINKLSKITSIDSKGGNKDNLNEPDSGYEGSITTNNNFRFKQFLSAAATTTTGRPEKLRYCESHQRLYRGSPSLSSTTTTSSTSSSSSSSSSSSTQLNPFSLFNNRSSLKIQRPKNNQQKAPTTTKWMHKRYRQLTTDNKSQYNSSNGGRGRSMSNDRFNEQNDYNDDDNNDDDDDFDDDLMLIDCPDCYRKYSRKKDYRKFMLSKCLKSAIDKDMMIKPTDFDEFIDEICQKFDQQQQHQTNDDDDDRHRKLLQFSSTNRNRQSNDNNNNGGKQQQEEKVKTTTELILDQAKRYYDAFPALGNESMIMTKSSSSSSSTTSTLKSSSGSRSNSHSGSSSRNKISISENFRSSQQSSFDDSVFIDNNNGQTLVDNNDNDESWNGKKIIRNIVEKYQPKLNVISTNVEDFHHQQQQELQNQSTTTASSSNSIQQQPQNLGKPLVVKLKSKLLGNNNKSRTGLIVTTSSTSNIDNIDNDNTNNNNNANININNNNNGDRMTTLKKLSTTINNNNNNSIILMNNNYNNNNNNDETINGKRMEMVKNSEHYDQQQQQQNQSILAENQILSATIKSITNHNNNNNTHSNHNSSSSTGLSAKEIEKINQLMPSYLMNQHSKTNLTQTTISTMTTTTTTTTTLPSTSTISVIKLKNDKNNKHYSSNQTMNRSINVQNVVIGEQQRKLSTLSSINHRSYSNTKRDFQSSNNGRKFQPYQKLSIISSTDKYQDKIADNQIVDDQHDDEEKNGQSLTKNDGKSVDSLLPDFLKSTSVQQQSPIKQKLSMAINDEKILENSILAKDDIENDNEKNVNENININSDDDDDGHTKMTVKCSSLKQLSPLFLLMDCQNVIDNDNQNDLLFNNNLNEELSLIIDLVQQQRQCQNQMTDNEKTTNSNEFNLTTIDSDGDVGGATIDSKLLNFYSFDDEMMQHFRKNFAEKMNNYHLNVNNNDNNSKCPNQINECFQTSLSIPIQSTGSSTSSLSSSFSNSDDLPSDFDVEKIPTSFLHKDQNNTTIESANVVEEIAPKPSGPFSKRYKLKSNANSADDNSKNDDNNYINGHVVTSNTNVDHSTFYSLRTSSYRHQQQNWYPTGSELQNDCSDYQGPHDDNIYYYGDDMDGGIMIDQNEATHFVESYGNDLYNYDGYLINMPKDDNNDFFLTSSNDIDNLQPVDIKFKLENRYLVPDSDAKPVLKPCAFYLENACARLDCKFSHDLSSIPCKYYLEGACYKEEFCPFLHEKPKSDFDQIDSETLNSSTTSYMNFKSSQFKIESDSDFPSLFDEPKNTSSETNDNLFENQRVNFLYKTTTNLMKPAVVDARKSPLQSNDMKSNYEDSIPSSSSSYIANSSYSSQNFAKCFNATKTAKTSSSSLVLPSPQQQLKIKVVEQPKQEEEEWPSLSGSIGKIIPNR
ncbi:hypothetical protein DERP_010853 [Dermatophagoides pteronyssinus]|uniref:C3H1-type domain-containing protein n=1 Tax=Dermatophagoides pteronyssinus TaxID=6956 RepID=A0ABQ8JUL8_DERPT|nr:hypothetical protein DERP_010853 [Dermatophagoides pteronyssinus]